MVQRRRMGFSGLTVGVSILVMFWVTDALDIGGRSAAKQANSLAATPDDVEGACRNLAHAAKGVMQARQAGAARETVAEVLAPLGEDGEVMLALAYAYPLHEALEDKELAVVEFVDGIETQCLSKAVPQE